MTRRASSRRGRLEQGTSPTSFPARERAVALVEDLHLFGDTTSSIERAILDAERAERAACLALLDREIAKHPQPEHMFTLAARAAAVAIRARR